MYLPTHFLKNNKLDWPWCKSTPNPPKKEKKHFWWTYFDEAKLLKVIRLHQRCSSSAQGHFQRFPLVGYAK